MTRYDKELKKNGFAIPQLYTCSSCGNIYDKNTSICKCEIERKNIIEISKFTTECIEYFHKLVKEDIKHVFTVDDIQQSLSYICEQYYLRQKIKE